MNILDVIAKAKAEKAKNWIFQTCTCAYFRKSCLPWKIWKSWFWTKIFLWNFRKVSVGSKI